MIPTYKYTNMKVAGNTTSKKKVGGTKWKSIVQDCLAYFILYATTWRQFLEKNPSTTSSLHRGDKQVHSELEAGLYAAMQVQTQQVKKIDLFLDLSSGTISVPLLYGCASPRGNRSHPTSHIPHPRFAAWGAAGAIPATTRVVLFHHFHNVMFGSHQCLSLFSSLSSSVPCQGQLTLPRPIFHQTGSYSKVLVLIYLL